MKRTIPFLLAMLVAAQVAAIDGLPLMKVDLSARPAGMAGAFAAINNDPTAAMYNPAGIAGAEQFRATFGHVQYWENIHLESGFVSLLVSPKSYLNFNIRYAADNDLEAREIAPTVDPDALFSANTAAFNGTFAMQLSPRVSGGIGIGWYLDKIEAWRGSAFNANFGLQFVPAKHARLGAAVLNLGPSYTLSKPGAVGSRDISQPTTIRLGGSYSYARYLGALDVVIVDDEARAHLGAEAMVHKNLTARAGYIFNHDTRSFSAGVTISWRNLGLNYAIAPYRDDLGLTHLFSLTVNL